MSGEEVSRRAVLGAAAALPVSSSFRRMPESTFPCDAQDRWTPDQARGDAEWEQSLAAYRSAEGAVEGAGRVCAAAAGRAEIHSAEDAFGDRLEELYEALRHLLRVPAPGIGAFLIKVEAAFEHEIATLCENDASIAAIRADVRRLMAHQSGTLTGTPQGRQA